MAGLGVASTQIMPPIAALPYIKITAAADTRTDALGKFRETYGGETFPSVEAMCESADVDAIYVATPNPLHAKHVIAAAERGKHVIVEKPMAMSIAECDAMNEAAEKYGVKLLCGHTHSFDPPIRKIREIVKSGELGKLCMINTWNYNEFMYRPRMKHELAMSRGVVLNQGPHHVDIVRLIGGGMVRSVRAMTGVWDKAREWEGSYTCYLEFEDGTPATLVYSGYGFFDTAELVRAGSAKADNIERRKPISTSEKNCAKYALPRKKNNSKKACASAASVKANTVTSGAAHDNSRFSASRWSVARRVIFARHRTVCSIYGETEQREDSAAGVRTAGAKPKSKSSTMQWCTDGRCFMTAAGARRRWRSAWRCSSRRKQRKEDFSVASGAESGIGMTSCQVQS